MAHTHDNGAIGCAIFPWTRRYKNCDATTKNGRVMKIWRFLIFMNFDKLHINYELILSKISKNGLQTHPPPWLRNIKIHIIDPSPWLRDSKILSPTHTKMACATHITLFLFLEVGNRQQGRPSPSAQPHILLYRTVILTTHIPTSNYWKL